MSRSGGVRGVVVSAVLLTAALVPLSAQVSTDWVQFVDETTARLSAPLDLLANDVEEKDYAWGDVDQDGDVDLIVVRKQPFSSDGKRTNLLLLNEGGVLVDQTAVFATESDIPGDLGFNTPTNDRDVVLVDVNNDTFLDIVTAVTISDGDPKHIGHPRIYINKGGDVNGWRGFRHEDARIPEMPSYTGQLGHNPRFCSVSAGDVTGDGFADLYFTDYDSSINNSQPPGADFNDRLLVNTGTGHFVDTTTARLIGLVPGIDQPFDISAFGAASAIADINGDGYNDILKQTSLQTPLYVGVAYNDPDNEGFFDTYEVISASAPYFASLGDLNNDGMLDVVITDDGLDRYLINQGNDPDGTASFLGFTFGFDVQTGDDGFGGNSLVADLNGDGWDDVLITDVDVDDPSCARRMHIYRNLAGEVGSNVALQEQTTGDGCDGFDHPQTCNVAGIPSNMLEGVHDVAVFDLNGDTWNDLVIGRCTGTEVWMNQPQTRLEFNYPEGLPQFVPPNETFDVLVQVFGFGGESPEPRTAQGFASVDGGPFNEFPMTDLSDGNLYIATLPGVPDCPRRLDYYFTVKGNNGPKSDPPTAPNDVFSATAAFGTDVVFADDVEGDVSGWTVVDDPSVTGGSWEQAWPNGTLHNGEVANPNEDADPEPGKIMAFVTENGPESGVAFFSDLDFGPTDLISPVFDLAGGDAMVSYSRWFFSDGGASLTVWVTPNGADWTLVETVTGLQNFWQPVSFQVGDYITPSATVQLRFRADDPGNGSLAEAGVDALSIVSFDCIPCNNSNQCSDGIYCNGAEQCDALGFCLPGGEACPGQTCDEPSASCADCFTDGDCDDGVFCNGPESCTGNSCVTGAAPCPGQLCSETLQACVTCLVDSDCDDGVFCNGAETCSLGGLCSGGTEPCGGVCDEDLNVCPTAFEPQPRMGRPLSGLSAEELQRFDAGKTAFNTSFTEATGLGPTFNQFSCGNCHSNPAGGSGTITVTRFGFNDGAGGFDPLNGLGGSLLQSQATESACLEVVPGQANVTAQRLTPSTLGFGLVEAIPDVSILVHEVSPPGAVSGVSHSVPVIEDPPEFRVGRFGWKSQLATVLSFSADAALNEMGLTNRLLPQENAPNGDVALLTQCDTQADPEDAPDLEGFEFIDRVTDFQRFLAPPPQMPRWGTTGESLFESIGCDACHVRSFTTADDPQLEDALRSRLLKPYSDFLLHDMGLNSDFIAQRDASTTEMRTTPLWGLRVRDPLWHDGRVAGGTFGDRVRAAIALHDAVGSEASASGQAFASLDPSEQDAIVAFLDGLGRAEFDHDGDNDVDAFDFAQLQACHTGPGAFFTADDPCAVSDFDHDGDVDDDDQAQFVVLADGVAGAVPDGAGVPGAVLTVDRQGADLVLSWGASCLGDDVDYEIYQGVLGDFGSHAPLTCSTAGATTATVTPSVGDAYFLVVPTTGFREGSYGVDGAGIPRPPGSSACLPQSIGACL